MDSQFSPNCYFSSDVFKEEAELLFPNIWTFVGFTTDIPNHNDYITRRIGKTPILIQTFDGKIKAFLNVCTHRFSTLHQCERGNRPLVCPYHGWFFDNDGKPKGIPDKQCFTNLDSARIESLSLEEWEIATCGKFIFVKKKTSLWKISLSEYLGGFYDQLLSISDSINLKIETIRFVFDCNWKIAIENAIEQYHVGPVHPKTFGKLGLSGGTTPQVDQYHSSWVLDVGDDAKEKWDKIKSNFSSRTIPSDHFAHTLIFPMLAIGSTFGASYSISSFYPISESQTEFRCEIFGCNLPEASKRQLLIANAYWENVVQFNRQVFDEDKGACQWVQQGVPFRKGDGIISNLENRVFYFQKSYSDLMSILRNI